LIKVFTLIEGDVYLDLKLWHEKHVLFFTSTYEYNDLFGLVSIQTSSQKGQTK